MSWNWEVISETGLQFFGKMSASISHEMKNVMAIINENAGLLEDLTVMAEKGMPIDPQRLRTQASRIMKQIRRGDDIIKGMNRFAHSVDEPWRQVELNDTWAQVQQALSSLPLPQRVVVVLYYINDLSLQEISDILEIPVGTVKSRLHYGRQALKEHLALLSGESMPELQYEFT